MSFRAWLPVQVLPGQRDPLVRAFIERGVIEECRATIAGFVRGELLLSESDPDALSVSVEWVDRRSFLDWQASPVRSAQGPAFMQWVASAPVSELYRVAHVVSHE